MSQAKVEKYKKEKATRKQTIARNKVLKHIRHAVEAVVLVAIVAGIVYYGVSKYEASQPAETYYVNLEPMETYINGLSE